MASWLGNSVRGMYFRWRENQKQVGQTERDTENADEYRERCRQIDDHRWTDGRTDRQIDRRTDRQAQTHSIHVDLQQVHSHPFPSTLCRTKPMPPLLQPPLLLWPIRAASVRPPDDTLRPPVRGGRGGLCAAAVVCSDASQKWTWNAYVTPCLCLIHNPSPPLRQQQHFVALSLPFSPPSLMCV